MTTLVLWIPSKYPPLNICLIKLLKKKVQSGTVLETVQLFTASLGMEEKEYEPRE